MITRSRTGDLLHRERRGYRKALRCTERLGQAYKKEKGDDQRKGEEAVRSGHKGHGRAAGIDCARTPNGHRQ